MLSLKGVILDTAIYNFVSCQIILIKYQILLVHTHSIKQVVH